ncbi:MG2 domain-containing protein [Niastella populi]|uniref:Macroglobulin domain-containing protein n=1 Tax=Niastella populi TaxID=550983 RepID=A0A1V9G545_9BACT|nr:MG2 domain-containing protein [Niastella populi]OQP65596.1 hypothetical protein A4R26_14275 [Niastella populi]
MKPLSVILLLFVPFNYLPAQTTGTSPDAALAAFKNNYPQEKVFLQTDKTYYFPGETIWMKAWCALDGAPSYLSRILYVDLVNSQGEVISKKMYKLDSLGSTPADLELPAQIESGNYTLNAYTLWMLNFPQFVYHRHIFVYNSGSYQKATTGKPGISIRFFPEGGELIAGSKSRIAFKATDKNGWPVAIQGTVTDNTGRAAAGFATEHDGMGVFEMDVEAGKTYTAAIANGNNEQYKLPVVKEEGIGLRVENTNPNRVFVLLNRAEKNKEKYGLLKLVAQMHHQVVFRAGLNFDEGQMAAPIPKKNLPPGIMQITVFDERNNPLAERLVFIENYQLIAPRIITDTLNTKARGRNQFSFSVNDVGAATLSCLVTSDIAGTTLNQEDNIASSLLLTTDLPGQINNPGYYFKNKEPQTLHHLNLLLMTHGWRRFEWKRILQNDYATLKYPVESAITFSGLVTKSDRREPVKDGKVSFIIRGDDSTSLLAEAILTDKGEFLLNNVNYMKSAAVAYMGTNNKKENFVVDVKLNPAYIDSLKQSLYHAGIDLDTVNLINKHALGKYIYGQMNGAGNAAFKNAKTLQGVTVTARKQNREDSLNREYAGGPFLMGKSIDPSATKYARTIWQIIQQTVPGVTVEGNPFDPKVSFNRFNALGNEDVTVDAGGSSDGGISNDIVMQTNGIAYYLNEVNVSKDIINTLSVEDVALIKVLKNEGAVLGASQGVIALYTKKGITANKLPFEKSYTVIKREGYAIVRQFYSTGYSQNPEIQGSDNRHTLYWNGKITPAKDGTYRFRFFNNDTSKQFRLVIQGVDKEGQLIYGEQLIQ